jgi:hypothetical protein
MKRALSNWFTTATFAAMAAVSIVCPAHAQAQSHGQAQGPSRAQSLLGATNPKLAELTDKVLYDDVSPNARLVGPYL